jgi:hypothetical protein
MRMGIQRRIEIVTTLALLVGIGGASGCNRDVRLAGKGVKTVTVRPVTHYGVTLDEQASPEQTVYALLHAIRDDFIAMNKADRDAALGKQFDVCAANVIAASNPTSLGRDQYIHRAVTQWTPTVSHYASDFETDWEKAEGRFVRVGPKPTGEEDSAGQACQIFMEVNDPNGDPNSRAVLVVSLVLDQELWRVARVGFTSRARALKRRAVVVDPGKVAKAPGG